MWFIASSRATITNWLLNGAYIRITLCQPFIFPVTHQIHFRLPLYYLLEFSHLIHLRVNLYYEPYVVDYEVATYDCLLR